MWEDMLRNHDILMGVWETASGRPIKTSSGCLGAVTFASNFFNFCYCPVFSADCDNADKGYCRTG